MVQKISVHYANENSEKIGMESNNNEQTFHLGGINISWLFLHSC